jgi:hypothetical protein
MMTIVFSIYALLQLALFVWLWRTYRATGAAIAIALFIPQFGLIYDNAAVVVGRFIGIGPTLEAISWPRFWIHWLFGTWLIIAAGSVLRMAGIGWAQSRAVMAAFCLLTVGLMIYDLPHFWRESLYAVCEFDLVRYSTAVKAGTGCLAGQAAVKASAPLPSIITCFVVIGAGLVLMIKRRFPWMFMGGVLMLLSAAIPIARHYKLDNFGEVLIAGGAIWAIARFAPRKPLGRAA